MFALQMTRNNRPKAEPLIDFFAWWLSPEALRLFRRGFSLLLGAVIVWSSIWILPALFRIVGVIHYFYFFLFLLYGVSLLAPPRWISKGRITRWAFIGLSLQFCVRLALNDNLDRETMSRAEFAGAIGLISVIILVSVWSALHVLKLGSEQDDAGKPDPASS